MLSFTVSRQQVAAGTTPFLASLDPSTGKWLPVPSTYDPTTGTVSARVRHFSVWAPLQWVESRVEAVLGSALASAFSQAGLGTTPTCTGTAVTVTDSRPHHGVAACAGATGSSQVKATFVDQRPYAVDLIYPAAVQVLVPAGDAFAELGADLTRLESNYHYQILLPGGGEADATLPMSAGQKAEFKTEFDSEAYLWTIIGTGIRTLVQMGTAVATTTAKSLVNALGSASCLADVADIGHSEPLSLDEAKTIGSAAFDCLTTTARGLSGALATVASIVASLYTELAASAYAAIDSASGNASHDLILTRVDSVSCSPQLLFKAAASKENFNPNDPSYSLMAAEGNNPGAYDVVCDDGWAFASISRPNVGTSDGATLFRAAAGLWTEVGTLGGEPADCQLEKDGVPKAVAETLLPPSHSFSGDGGQCASP